MFEAARYSPNSCRLKFSAVEIYGEELRDLLNPCEKELRLNTTKFVKKDCFFFFHFYARRLIFF